MAQSMSALTPAEEFNRLAQSCHLPDSFRLSLIHLRYGTIPLLASIDSGLCTPAPTALALQEVVLLCTTALPRLVFTAEDIRRLRGFAMSCHYGMVNAQQSGLHGLGLVAVPVSSPAPAPATPTNTPA